MNFQAVEQMRQAYLARVRAISYRRNMVVLILSIIVFIPEFIVLALNFNHFEQSMGGHWPSLSLGLLITGVLLVEFGIILCIALIFTIGQNANTELVSYRHAYKAYFIERQLASVFTHLDYHHDRGLDKNLLKATGMINIGDIYHSNDLVQAQYRGVKFLQADVHIQNIVQKLNQDGTTTQRKVTAFKGRYFVFDFPKKFAFKMMVVPSSIAWDEIRSRVMPGKFRVIRTESPEFNRRLTVYAEDGFEAFYLLAPDFIERLQILAALHHDQIFLYFSANKFYLGINDGNDIFEPPNPSLPIDERAEFAKVFQEISLITEIVDGLKLAHK